MVVLVNKKPTKFQVKKRPIGRPHGGRFSQVFVNPPGKVYPPGIYGGAPYGVAPYGSGGVELYVPFVPVVIPDFSPPPCPVTPIELFQGRVQAASLSELRSVGFLLEVLRMNLPVLYGRCAPDGAILLADGISYLLLTDGVSKIFRTL